MRETEDTVLFGKYQIIGTLGSGRNGSVLLAVHLGLQEYRAIKRVRKEEGGRLREAEILKTLRHPGIPVIYDLYESQEYYYIVQEYLEGHSLSALVQKRGSLTRAEILSYGNELCRILVYLHSLKPNPILHLDLQPKNLLICGGTLKLIDFGQSVFASVQNGSEPRFATPGFAAPELYRNEIPDERADIYAIGALLFFMGTGRSPESASDGDTALFGSRLKVVIEKCLDPLREKRFQTVEELLEALCTLKTGISGTKERPLLTIAVAGSRPGTGATHAALALSSFLTVYAGPCLYEERNASGAAASLGQSLGAGPDRRGIFTAGILSVKPCLGEQARPDDDGFFIRVLDLGTLENWTGDRTGEIYSAIREAALVLLVCGGREWEISDSRRAVRKLLKMFSPEHTSIRLLVNRQDSRRRVILPEEASSCIAARLPWIEDPFQPLKKEAERTFFRLLSGTEGEKWLLRGKEGGFTAARQRFSLLRLAKDWNKRRRRGCVGEEGYRLKRRRKIQG